MNKVVSTFLDRLAERFAALVAGLISSRVEGLHAAAQAEQQSALEDLARAYEADGKEAIAHTLRNRAQQLASANLAAVAVEIMQQTSDPIRPALLDASGTDPRSMPVFDAAKTTKRRRTSESTDPAFPSPEAQS